MDSVYLNITIRVKKILTWARSLDDLEINNAISLTRVYFLPLNSY